MTDAYNAAELPGSIPRVDPLPAEQLREQERCPPDHPGAIGLSPVPHRAADAAHDRG